MRLISAHAQWMPAGPTPVIRFGRDEWLRQVGPRCTRKCGRGPASPRTQPREDRHLKRKTLETELGNRCVEISVATDWEERSHEKLFILKTFIFKHSVSTKY